MTIKQALHVVQTLPSRLTQRTHPPTQLEQPQPAVGFAAHTGLRAGTDGTTSMGVKRPIPLLDRVLIERFTAET